MRFESSRGIIAYEAFGVGRPILFLHGWPLDRRSMIGPFEPLFAKREGWHRVYPDLPGMGETGALADVRTPDDVLDVLVEFAAHLADGGPIAVAGLSYGGLLVQGLAHRIGPSLDGLLAVVPSMGERERRIPAEFHVIHREAIDFIAVDDETQQGFETMAVVQTQEHLDAWDELIVPGVAAADGAFLDELDKQQAFSFDHRRLPQPLKAPTLFLTGRQDNVCGYREATDVMEQYPRGTFVVLDRAGHCLNFEQPALFDVLVAEWLDRIEEHASVREAGE